MSDMQRMTERQEELLHALEERVGEISIDWDGGRGVVSDARARFAEIPEVDGDGGGVLSAVNEWLELFGIHEPDRQLRLLRRYDDELGWQHYEFQQVSPDSGLDVYGGKLAVHVDEKATVYDVQSSCWPVIEVSADPRVSIDDLRERFTALLEGVPAFHRRGRLKGDGADRPSKKPKETADDGTFPLAQEPTQVVLPWKSGFRLAWVGYAYGAFDPVTRQLEGEGPMRFELGQFFVDAVTGEVLLFAPGGMDAETADTGSGRGVTPIGAPASRTLNVVRVDNGNSYRLRDTTQARTIVTYDAANSASWDTDTERGTAIGNGSLLVSDDTDGDKNWNRLPANNTTAERTASQQPETDLHFFMTDVYEWFEALGRTGWDNGQFASPPVPNQTLHAIAHVSEGGSATSINAGMRRQLVSGNWVYWLQFFDGDRTTYDYLAGSNFIVSHEYQHAVTEFSFRDGAGNPGLTYSDWLAAVHEGLSDVFGGLYSEQWLPGTDISPNGQIFRNLVFPRDDGPPPATAAYDANKFDHFTDATGVTGTSFRYHRGTVLAHCAYLAGRGGVQQRSTRTPALIPVVGLGTEMVNGRSVLKAARIWNRGLNVYVSTIGSSTGSPTNDANVFRTIRNACVNAAIDLYGNASREHLTTMLAWYAVGLHPTTSSYGADPTFLTWGIDWQLSQPYVGLNSPLWSSLDLFINNGGASEWNAQINVIDASGNPTQYENNVYCRVRNVGDQPATNVHIEFFYAKVGTNPTGWQPVLDKNGVTQVLDIASLGAGASTFTDAQQGSPPATAGIKWWVPPLAAGETVNHYCVKAVLTAANDANGQNNEVQSNVSYTAYVPGATGAIDFVVSNAGRRKTQPYLRVAATLPEGWRFDLEGDLKTPLGPGEERTVQLRIEMPDGADRRVEPPYDGEVTGHLSGQLTGPVTGTLTGVVERDARLEATMALQLAELGGFTGGFTGRLSESGDLVGVVRGPFACAIGSGDHCVAARFVGWLRPWRRIDVSQLVNRRPIGGITVQVQVPTPVARPPVAPTTVFVEPT